MCSDLEVDTLSFYITPVRYLILLAVAFLLLSCASKSSRALHGSMNYDAVDRVDGVTVAGWEENSEMMADSKVMRASASAYAGGNGKMYAESFSPRVERMVNYTGNIALQSSEPEAIIDTVVQKAKEKGGLITERRNGFVLLQIPVAEFRTFFNYILTLGSVMNKNIFANDITDAFTDNAERLRIAESTLARLQELLSHAKSEQEKIALLKEIQRVNEQIEQAKLTEKELLRMAAFSTISLNVWNNAPVPRPLNAKIKAFDWFGRLGVNTEALKLSVPQNFIETVVNVIPYWENTRYVDVSPYWKTASALNSQFFAYKRENEPQGTIDFWANAMLEYFKPQYKAELKTEDNFSLIRFQDLPTQQIRYIAILKTSDKKTLKIAEAIFQNAEAEKQDSEAILEVLRRVK